MAKAQRGEVWLADLGLAAKTRPVLVINVEYDDAERALFAVVPHTTAKRGGRFEVNVKVRWLEDGAFDVQGTRPATGSFAKAWRLGRSANGERRSRP